MKKIKRMTKKMPSIVIVFAMIFTMVLGYFVPLSNAYADNKYIISFTTNDNHEMVNENGHLKIDGQYVEIRDDGDQAIGEVSCSTSKACTITVDDGTAGKLNFNSANKFTLYMQGHVFDMNHTFTADENIAVQDYEEEHFDEPGEEIHFDGKAYVVWSCGNGTCYHYFDNIPSFDDGNSKFYKNTDVKADNDNSIIFDVHAKRKDWILKEGFERWVNAYKEKNNVSEIDWTTVDPKDIIGDPPDMRQWEEAAIEANECTRENTPQDEFERCVDDYMMKHSDNLPFVKLQPVGEPEDNNAYVSYGDRNFKVVIYNEEFKGVTIGDLSDLHYYPASWMNAYIRRDQFDISGTTKDNPTAVDSILLENTVVIKPLSEYNSFKIDKIEALDVPEDAVTITKENGEVRLVFSSNFYDNVIFKVTDTNGGVSYMQIKRYTIDGWIRFANNHPVLTADFYFDRTKSYTDFDLTAKIVYKDGTTKNVKLTAAFGVDDGMGNITEAYEVDEENPQFGPKGKGLKKSTFEYPLSDGEDRNIKKVYLNAEFKGSTASNYAGSYVGSGEGVLANIYQGEDD